MNIMLTYRTTDDVVIWLLSTYYHAQSMYDVTMSTTIIPIRCPHYTTHTTMHMHMILYTLKAQNCLGSQTMHATVEIFMTTCDSLTTKIMPHGMLQYHHGLLTSLESCERQSKLSGRRLLCRDLPLQHMLPQECCSLHHETLPPPGQHNTTNTHALNIDLLNIRNI